MSRLDQRILIFGLAVVLLYLLVAVSSTGYQAAVTADDAVSITNESWTVDQGNVTTLANSNQDVVYADSVEVRNDTDVVVEPDGNYTWYESNGTIRALAGAPALADASTASINYTYYEPSDRQRSVRNYAGDMGDIGMAMEFGLVAAVLLGAMFFIGRIR